MAIPTVIRFLPAGQPVGTPAEGPTGGRSLIEIYGDGFRVPTIPEANSGPSGPTSAGIVVSEVAKTVSVTFGGVEALQVDVIKSNVLRVTSPISPIAVTSPEYGAGSVDVVIQNLDDSGVAIPGESVTIAGGWTYRRVRLDGTADSDLLRMVKSFIEEWKRQVIPEVIFTSHTDWDSDISTPEIEVAKMPAIILNLTGLPENRFYSCNVGEEVKISDDRIEQRRKSKTVDLQFEVIGISDNPMEVLNLLALATDFMERNPNVYVIKDPSDPTDTAELELEFQPGQDFGLRTRPNSSNIHFFTGAIVIKGFTSNGLAGLPGDSIVGLFRTLKDTPSLDAESLAG